MFVGRHNQNFLGDRNAVNHQCRRTGDIRIDVEVDRLPFGQLLNAFQRHFCTAPVVLARYLVMRQHHGNATGAADLGSFLD